jgi:hypothetical protein
MKSWIWKRNDGGRDHIAGGERRRLGGRLKGAYPFLLSRSLNHQALWWASECLTPEAVLHRSITRR